MDTERTGLSVRSLIVGAIFAIVFALLTVYFENRAGICITASQIAVLPYILMFLTVLMINPLCRLLRRARPFTVTEILIVFIMGSVSAGISTFGLASQLVPVSGSLFNRSWNTDQSEWNRYVSPAMNEGFFLSVPGIRVAAKESQAAQEKLQKTRQVYEAALRVQRTEESMEKANTEFEKAGTTSETEQEIAKLRAGQLRDAAKEANREAATAWDDISRSSGGVPRNEVLARWPAQIAECEKTAAVKRDLLRTLETQAFAQVDLFRRGLGEGKRAFPGILPVVGDSLTTYSGRSRRLVHGLAARRQLERGLQILDPLIAAGAAWNPAIAAQIEERIGQATISLEKSRDITRLQVQAKTFEGKRGILQQRLLDAQGEFQRLGQERRSAPASDFRRLDRNIQKVTRQEKSIQNRMDKIKKSQEQIQRELATDQLVGSTVEALQKLKDSLHASALAPQETKDHLQSLLKSFPAFDASLRRYFLSDIPWSQWLRPLLYWGILLALTYVILMSFNLLIHRQWARNEKLIYPLAELPEWLAGHGSDGDGRIPGILRNGVFWAGFAISGFVLGWNLLSLSKVIPGLQPFDLMNIWRPYIQNSALSGLLPSAKSHIFFTMIGLSFLIPARISFSLWFFSILYMVQLLILVWSGYGVNEYSFPSEWLYTLNFRTAEGGGALIVFSTVVLWKCRSYILCFFMPHSVRDLEIAEQKELRTASFLFVFGSVGLIIGLWKGMGANLFFTVFCYLVVIVITIGMIRAVTEGGMLGFQAWTGPFHLIRTLFGMNKTWTVAPLFAPLLVYYSIIFFDIKTFIAPAMANSIKIREDLKMKRGAFHLAVFLAILLAAVAAVAAHLMMSYDKGGDQMHGWFYNGLPQAVFGQIGSMTKVQPVDTSANRLWFGFGAALMAALLYCRQFLFWLPHPLGMIMLVNPIMKTYWFSIFVGWLCKTVVTKYGNKNAYDKMKNLFVGLIVGELVVVMLTLVISVTTGQSIPIDLNRNE
jgi:hypothetical protein